MTDEAQGDFSEPGPELAPAWVSRALVAYRRSGQAWVLAGVFLVAAMSVTVFVTARNGTNLERVGVHTPATVVRVEHGGMFFSEGDITVRFAVDGISHSGHINLDSNSPSYSVGDSVDVIYDPRDVTNIRTSRETNDPSWTVIVLAAGVIGGPVGIGVGGAVLLRARRWRRIVAGGRWRTVRATFASIPAGQSVEPLIELTEGSSSVVRRVTTTLRWRLRSLKGVSEAWVVGPLDGVMVVTSTVPGPLYEVRPGRGPRRQSRMEKKFDKWRPS